MDAVDLDVLLVGRQATGLWNLEGLLAAEACAATWPPGEAPDRALLTCQLAVEASPLLGLRLVDAAGRPADCLAVELQTGCGLAAQAYVRNARIRHLGQVLAAELTTAYPGPALSNPRPSLNLAAPEPLFLKST